LEYSDMAGIIALVRLLSPFAQQPAE
jgi:hypothetical protein